MFILSGCEKNTDSPGPTASPSIIVKDPEKTPEPTESPDATEIPTKPEFKYNEYDITMEVMPEERRASGVETILFYNRYDEPLKEICLNVYLNAFSEKSSYKPYFSEFENKIFKNSGLSYGHMEIINVSVNGIDTGFLLDNTILRIKLKDEILPGHGAEIALQFDSVIPKISHRTGANNYAMWLGNFFPILSVFKGGEWVTEPYYPAGDPFVSDIANYTVKVKTPIGYTVAGTGDDTVTLGEQTQETVLTAKMVRDMAIAISNSYHVKSRQIDTDLYVNIYYYSDVKNIDELLEIADKSIKYYSSVVGTYPYSSFNIIETELFFGGGMEYPQTTFIDTANLKSKDNLTTLCHEIGHQWFYNILGSDQINEAWLDEGLTLFMQMGILYSDEEISQIMENYYENLSLRMLTLSNKSLADKVSVYENWSQYYNIHYRKSCLMFYSLKNLMGEELFTKLIQKYYLDNCYKLSSGEIFVKTAEEIYGESLEDFFDAWISKDELPPLIYRAEK